MIWIIASAILLTSTAALAHGSSAEFLATDAAWSYDPWLTIPLYLASILFLVGTHALWRRAGVGHGVRVRQVASFWAGWSMLALAFVSPLHWLGERLFSAHMIEHELLMIVAAPLIAFARPGGVLLWGLPRKWRKALGGFTTSRPIAVLWTFVGTPLTATVLQAAALWLWHIPRAYELALTSEAVHRLQHLSFFLSALLFWFVLFYGRGRERGERVRDGINVGCLFLTVLHCGLLGALLTLSPKLWVNSQAALTAEWGLTPLEDQQVAGLLMWIPMGAVYTAGALFFAWRWLGCGFNAQPAHAQG